MSTATVTYPSHRLADLVPPMSTDDYRALVESIRSDGLEHPITLYEGAVLDGRHRLRACLEVGVEPRFKTYDGDDPARFVLRQETRRHLTVSQRAMMAQAFLPELQRQARERQAAAGRSSAPGRPARNSESRDTKFARAAEEAAEIVGVGHATINRAASVVRQDPQLAERVKAGELSVMTAYNQVTSSRNGQSPKEEPTFVVTTERQRSLATAAKERIENAVGTCNGIARGFDGLQVDRAVAVATETEIQGWDESLQDAMRAMKRLRLRLKESQR